MCLTRWLLAAFMAAGSVLASAQDGSASVEITLPPPTLTQWLQGRETPLDTFYQKYLLADSIPIVSSRHVSDEALLQARYIITTMMSRIPDARDVMLQHHFRVGIVGKDENVTDMPECRIMPKLWPGTDWDKRGRGYGATPQIPLMTCGEENIVFQPDRRERYAHESIMVHEFGHNIDFALRRARPGFEARLQECFRLAKEEGLWRGTYSMTNSGEYFAEGLQAWFNTCNMYVELDGRRQRIKTRDQLLGYDPRLHALLAGIMPETYLKGYHFDE